MADLDYTIAVFPFLKTSAPVKIGNHLFRSTDDVDELPPLYAKAVRELAPMLFVQGDLRVRSATYTVIPGLEVHSGDPRLAQLRCLREVVAYLYSFPHPVFDNVFLSADEVSLVLFTPGQVTSYLTRPSHHTSFTSPPSGPEPGKFGEVPGYRGLYNFRHHFWLEPGSRLYGPKPHMVLNISQDLSSDLEQWGIARNDFSLLLDLLNKPETAASQRVYSALHWYTAANEHGIDESEAVLNLAVAFETLLRLPEVAKTERLVDAISLLLGRTERLDDWAEQFYNARSRVAHEGGVADRYFHASDPKKRQIHDIFGSLMLYGRQVFQLCLGTLLVGMDLAARADLQEKLITNNERYQRICEMLKGSAGTPSERLLALAPTVQALERYHFVASGIESGPRLAAASLAAAALSKCDHSLPDEVAKALASCASSKREDSELNRLAAVAALDEAFGKPELPLLGQEVRVVREIVHLVWMSLFQQYYRLKESSQGRSAPI
jgi:hypothetical protein